MRFGLIDDVAVLPEVRRGGVARRLVSGAVEALGEKGCEMVALYADPHQVAQYLYLDLGFVVAHRFRMWFRPGRVGRVLGEFPLLAPAVAPLKLLGLRGAAHRRESPRVPDLGGFEEALRRGTAGLEMAPAPDPLYWKWKEGGPFGPRRVAVARDGEIVGGCRVVPQGLDIRGRTLSAHWIGDLFGSPGSDPVGAALRAHPDCALWVGISSPSQPHLHRLFPRNGFLGFNRHLLMVKPLGEGMRVPETPNWHVLMESAFGTP